MKAASLRVPAACLPDDDELRSHWLREVFPDHQTVSHRVGADWLLDVSWPANAEHYVDPDLEIGLHWWSPGTAIADIPGAVRLEPGFQLSLLDSWALLDWSRWLASQRDGVTDVVVLHVDDHDDLMSPHLTTTGVGFHDALTGRPFDVARPSSTEAAIRSGAVGPGSFIAPLIHAVARVHVRHLIAGGDGPDGPRRFSLRATTTSHGRMAVRPGPPAGGSSYLSTSSPDVWLDDLESGPVLLHVDLDGLANPFNGSTRLAVARTAPTESAPLQAAIGEIFGALVRHRVARLVESTTVALSPGFFPARLWEPAVTAVRAHMQQAVWCPEVLR